MTAEELKALDAKRKEREDELILLLLLLFGWSVTQEIAQGGSVVSGTTPGAGQALAPRQPGAGPSGRPGGRAPTGTQPIVPAKGTNIPVGGKGAVGVNLAQLRALLRTTGVVEIAGSMADAHLDAFALFGDGPEPDRDTLIRQYGPAATEMADAMLDTLKQAGGATLAESLLLAKYSRSDSTGLELGAERQIVTASNAGLIDGAIRRTSGPRLEGFLHRSVLDDRTTKICQERDGLQLPARDEYWLRAWPSLHWRCRSTIVPIFGAFNPSDWRPTTSPDVGFGRMPVTVRQLIRSLAA